jgi:hypothetical protein
MIPFTGTLRENAMGMEPNNPLKEQEAPCE